MLHPDCCIAKQRHWWRPRLRQGLCRCHLQHVLSAGHQRVLPWQPLLLAAAEVPGHQALPNGCLMSLLCVPCC